MYSCVGFFSVVACDVLHRAAAESISRQTSANRRFETGGTMEKVKCSYFSHVSKYLALIPRFILS